MTKKDILSDSSRLLSRRELLVGGALLAALIIGMIILSKPFGEFPVNDDWICAKDVIAFLSLGHLKYLGCESALFIPQIVIGAGLVKIFGFSFSLLRCVGWVALFASGVGLFTLLRRTGASTRDAAVGVALLTVFPPSFFNAAGFMTDMIFLSLWIWALVLLCSVDKSSSLAAKLGLVVLIVMTVLQRQFGVCLAGCALWRVYRANGEDQGSLKGWLVGGAVSAIIACAALQLWWYGQPRFGDVRFRWGFLEHRLQNIFAGAVVLGLLVVPFIRGEPFLRASGIFARLSLLLRAAITGGIAFFAVSILVRGLLGDLMPYFGNQISRYGTYYHVFFRSEVSEELLSAPAQWALTALGSVGALFLLVQAIACGGEKRSSERCKEFVSQEVVLVGGLAYIALLAVMNVLWFDRYLLPVVPAILVLAFSQREGNSTKSWRVVRSSFVCIYIGAIALWAVDSTFNHFSLYRAVWGLALSAERTGISPAEIRGGYEWDGWHRELAVTETVRGGAFGLFVAVPAKAYITLQPLQGEEILRKVEFDRLPWHSPGTVYLCRVSPSRPMY